ncbi:hypothetical protein DSO57_1002601 [Entomophthora muscae]|uniref:Uncharacterized protein n=1 Tax=Entomophthora muscae TaxID=34485 RepID=A0ACC2U751_9FUNG|nr:hypothetical protein DSO57_1002601 [Entomophthora muscae]
MPANFVAPPSIPEDENWVTSQCPEFYSEDALMLSQVIYLGLLWLGLIVLLNPGVTIGKFTKKYLKPRWWLIINSMWIWVVIPHHLETASYYPVISVTHTLSNLLENFGRAVSKLAVASATAIKKTKILLADFGLAWSANKTGVPAAMELMFAKTKHDKRLSAVYNKLCEFTEAFAGQRLHLVVYLEFLLFFRMGASVEDLDRVLLGINEAQLALDGKKVPPGYNSVDHVIQDALVLAGIYGFAASPEKLLLHSHLTLLPFTSRREYFNMGVSTVHGVAVEIVRHLQCGVGIYR